MLRAILVVALCLAAAPAVAGSGKSSCPEGQLKVKGKCVKACPTEGTFGEPDSCKCPEGFSLVLHGSGAGQCLPKACPTNSPFKETTACTCPKPYAKQPGSKKGTLVCSPQSAKAPATSPAR
jgi:hypothetical protein